MTHTTLGEGCPRKTLLEVCAGDIDSVLAAASGGADRVELCSGLEVGGLTPSMGLIRQARQVPGLKIHVLIRPRPGDFVYSPAEEAVMEQDIRQAVTEGADGIVIGALTAQGNVDVALCHRLIQAAGPGVSVTFHRAFDMCRHPLEALRDVALLGCDRLLTSGMAPSATEGVRMLSQLVREAPPGLAILAGAGINAANAASLVEKTGVGEVHASARSRRPSLMQYRQEGVAMGSAGYDEYSRMVTTADNVAAIVRALGKN